VSLKKFFAFVSVQACFWSIFCYDSLEFEIYSPGDILGGKILYGKVSKMIRLGFSDCFMNHKSINWFTN